MPSVNDDQDDPRDSEPKSLFGLLVEIGTTIWLESKLAKKEAEAEQKRRAEEEKTRKKAEAEHRSLQARAARARATADYLDAKASGTDVCDKCRRVAPERCSCGACLQCNRGWYKGECDSCSDYWDKKDDDNEDDD